MSDLLRRALTPAALTWAAGVRLHRAAWRGRRYRAPCPVVSVGALAMGGSGKTPMAWWVARELVALGATRVLLVVRGHGRRQARSAPVKLLDADVSPDTLRVDEVGDEAAMLADMRQRSAIARGVVLGVGRRRDLVIEAAADTLGPLDAVVLDDGLQHHRVARDLDLVLVAPDIERDRVFPAGRLREPLTALPGDAVLQIHAGDGLAVAAGDLVRRADVCSHNVLHALRCVGRVDASPSHNTSSWSGRPVALVTAVGRNDNVRRLVDEAGIEVVEHLARPDHARFTLGELDALCRAPSRAEAWLTTAKDWPRLREVLPDDAPPVYVLDVELVVSEGAALLRQRLGAL